MAKRIYFPGKRAVPPVSVERTVSRVRWPLKPHLVQFARGGEEEVTIQSSGVFFSKV